MEKTYLCKVYRSSVFLGLLEMDNEPVISQDINTAFAQLSIHVNQSADVSDEPVEPLLDELGNTLTDEFGATLYEERRPDIVGNSHDNIKIRKDNTILLYEVSATNPNGLLVFKGWITDWEADFGGSDGIIVTALSKGVDMQEYLIGGTENTDATQSQQDSATILFGGAGKGAAFGVAGQTFLVGPGVTNISAILAKLDTLGGISDNTVVLNLVRGFDGSSYTSAFNNIIASSIRVVAANSPIADLKFTFSSPVDVTPGETLFFFIALDFGGNLYYKNSDVYASGAMYTISYGGAGPIGGWGTGAQDLYFKTYTSNNGITAVYSSQDPSAIFENGMDIYIAQGGQASYSAATVDNTGLSVSYTFKLANMLKVAQKCLDLAPSDWYWYVHPGSLLAYFKQTPTTATHTFMKRRHIQAIKMKATTDNIANKLYFSGGDTGSGTNLLSVYTNSDSDSDRQRLATISDNRVTLQGTADTLADNFLEEHAEETYSSTLTIFDETYDISTINLGDTVGFRGFSYVVDSEILQIVHIERHPDYVVLTLGRLPIRETTTQAQAIQDIEALQTIDNPSTPS